MAGIYVGDRVRLTRDYDYLEAGEVGTVVSVDGDPEWPLGVEFDNARNDEDDQFSDLLNELFGVRPDPGWPVAENEVELV